MKSSIDPPGKIPKTATAYSIHKYLSLNLRLFFQIRCIIFFYFKQVGTMVHVVRCLASTITVVETDTLEIVKIQIISLFYCWLPSHVSILTVSQVQDTIPVILLTPHKYHTCIIAYNGVIVTHADADRDWKRSIE